ncbi:MAG TPA: hypothetical protein VFQ38_06095 [Longimicrobiales bacterium]|nr:hypothetical protein [Longimicrobiales bacterium]
MDLHGVKAAGQTGGDEGRRPGPPVERRAVPGAGHRPPRLLRPVVRVYDTLDRWWNRLITGRAFGFILSGAFVGALVAVELNRRGLVPPPLARVVPVNHFAAVAVAFWLLLFMEVLALVFVLPQSVANSVGKQFELLSLILLREAFLEFAAFGEPIDWVHGARAILVVVARMVGAFLIFVVLGVYYRLQRHRPITADEREQAGFIAAKKAIALVLLVAFVCLGIADVWRYLHGLSTFEFFEVFYTILIFSDVLIVLVSLAYTSGYQVVFRNSGFAAATVLIRLALTAPPFISVALGVGAALFAVALSAAYNSFGSEVRVTAAP